MSLPPNPPPEDSRTAGRPFGQARESNRPSSPRRGPWQPRFGLGTMMLVVLVCAMVATAGRYFIQALSSGTSGRAVFVIFVLVVPMFLLVVLNAFRLMSLWWNQAARRRRK